MQEIQYKLYELLFPNGKRYIGLTKNFTRRMSDHALLARRGESRPVYKAIRKYGWENVEKNVLVVGPKNYIADLEIRAIELFHCRETGYNISLGGELSPMLVEETRKKQSATLKGRKPSDAERLAMSIAQKGRKHSEETKLKIGMAHKGKKKSQSQIDKNRAAKIGKKLSEETKLKMSISRMGRVRSKETIDKARLTFAATMAAKSLMKG